MTFGAFAEIIPGVDGLIHISQIADRRIGKPEDVLSEGQEVDAKIIDIDQAATACRPSRPILRFRFSPRTTRCFSGRLNVLAFSVRPAVCAETACSARPAASVL